MQGLDKKLGDAIRAGRLRRNLTQKELAQRCGLSLRHLLAIERGANFSVAVLVTLANEIDELAPVVLSLLQRERSTTSEI